MNTQGGPAGLVIRKPAAILPLAAVPFFLVPFDSLTHLLGIDESSGAQTFPATAAFSLLYLALRGTRLQFAPASLAVFRRMALGFFLIAAITACNLAYESVASTHLEEEFRVPTLFRQAISFGLGLSSFLMFQDALLRVGALAAMRWMVWGCLPGFILVPFQAFSGVFRVQGFSTEPAQMADTLVFCFLPACVAAGLKAPHRRLLLAIGTMTLLSTFSSTGFMKLGMVLLCFHISAGRAMQGMVVVTAFVAAIGLLLSLWPENYVFSTFVLLYQSWDASSDVINVTFIDRYMGLIGPLSMLKHPQAWLGFGFGADSVYFYKLFDPDVAAAIREVKWTVPSITSLQGKVLLYGGVVSYLVYLSAWVAAWRATPLGRQPRFMIPAIFLASLFSLAPFFLPYVWLWLALGATASDRNKAIAARGADSKAFAQ